MNAIPEHEHGTCYPRCSLCMTTNEYGQQINNDGMPIGRPVKRFDSSITPYPFHVARDTDRDAENMAYDFAGFVFASRETGSVFECIGHDGIDMIMVDGRETT